jgi:Protein of unknown function (DUF2891)
MPLQLTRELASRFAGIALNHVTREYPAKMDHVLSGPEDVQSPRALHPAFYGSFDWHSCVHGFWLLAKLLRLFPDLPQAAAIGALFDEQLTDANIAGEFRYLQRPWQNNFERPYGWAWLLMLTSELARHRTPAADAWFKALQPLALAFAAGFKKYLPKLPYPIRSGTHANTAFAAALAIEYAQVCGDAELLQIVCRRMRDFFGADEDGTAFEPNGNDFHSPILVEVECMRRTLGKQDFLAWLARLLPKLPQREPDVLFKPVDVADRSDPQMVHLDGLNFSRAWCWRSLSHALAPEDSRRALAHESAEAHIVASLPHIATDYAGEHWLATFATLALTA